MKSIRVQASTFAALGDETRLQLVAKLVGGQPRSIAELTEGTRLTRQGITKHLNLLEDAAIVRAVRDGREKLYEFEPDSIMEMRNYLSRVARQWDNSLARLKKFVED